MKIYLIPGLGETCNLSRYKKMITNLNKIGYVVVPINPDWYSPISKQLFKVKKNDIIIGFSMGAIMAALLPQSKKILVAPAIINRKDYKDDVEFLQTKMPRRLAIPIARDWQSIRCNLDLKNDNLIVLNDRKHYFGAKYRQDILNILK